MADQPQPGNPPTDPADGGPQAADGGEGAEQVTVSREAWENLRQAADRSGEDRRLARENVLLRAGLGEVGEDSALGKVLYGYSGELSVEEAKEIAANFATHAGQGEGQPQEGQPQPEGPPLEPGEEQSTQQRRALAQGAPPDEQAGRDPHDEAVTSARQMVEEGATSHEAIQAYAEQIMGSDHPAAFVDPERAMSPDQAQRLARAG